MEGKVTQLAEKLLQEGVNKGEAEKSKIIAAAKVEAEALKKQAQLDVDALLAQAKKQAADFQVHAEKEIALAGKQALGALQQEITDLLTMKSVDEAITTCLSDPKIMAHYITTILAQWNGQLGADAALEILLPEAQKEALEKDLRAAMAKELAGGVTLRFSKALKGGFQIAPAKASYKITLSNEDFAEFFKEYLRPRVRTILFGA